MKGKLGDKVRLKHILDAISEVEQYLKLVTYDEFILNSEKRFATIKQIEIIGEACNALSPKLKIANQSVPWKPIIGFRNISIHEYFGINLLLVWEIAKNDLPQLEKQMKLIYDSFLEQ